MTSLNEAMASCAPWQVPGAANYASVPELFKIATTSSAVSGTTPVLAHRPDTTFMTPPLCLAARCPARSPR